MIGRIRKNRRTFEWELEDQKDVKRLLKMIQPYTRNKKHQVELGLKILDSKVDSKEDLYRIARLADTLSSFNVRSKGRRKNFATLI